MNQNNPAIFNVVPKELFNRELAKEIEKYLNRKEIIAIKGPRQSGKTTLMQMLYTKISKSKRSHFMTFEKMSDLEVFESDIESFKKLYVDKNEVLFIDEFQYAKEGGKKLKYLYDTSNCKFIISGSSSLELTSQTGKYLVGRVFSFLLLPLSFGEYLGVKDQGLSSLVSDYRGFLLSFLSGRTKEVPLSNLRSNSLVKNVADNLDEYLVYGGYPAVAGTGDFDIKKSVLRNVVDTYISRDIKELLQMSTDGELLELSRFLGLQLGQVVSYDELSNVSGLTGKQVKNHLRVLKETYVIDLVAPFFRNKRVELVKNPKVYFYDNGLRNSIVNNFSDLKVRSDKGGLYENFIFSSLKKSLPSLGVKFWRTKSQAEVDYILERGNSLLPIEVKSVSKKLPAPGKSFYSFVSKYKPEYGIIVTSDVYGTKDIDGTKVYYVPAFYF